MAQKSEASFFRGNVLKAPLSECVKFVAPVHANCGYFYGTFLCKLQNAPLAFNSHMTPPHEGLKSAVKFTF